MTRTQQRHETLAMRLAREGRLHLRVTGSLATQVAERLSQLHARDALHGELVPANVALAMSADPEAIDVVGLPHLTTPRGAPVFPEPSVEFSSPEVLLGFAPDSRLDCWAFAVLLFRCAYGHLPFRARNADELLRVVALPLVVPDAFGADTDALLTGFFTRCFAHRATARISSARAIGATFVALVEEAARISDDPFSFRPPQHETAPGVIIPISAAVRSRP